MRQGERSHIGVVIGQTVNPVKIQETHRLRREMTEAEKRLWQRLRGSRLGANFRAQQVVKGFIPDFYCNPALLAIEADSPSHDKEYDAERDRVFASLGILVLRFTNDQILNDLPNVLHTIRQSLRERLSNEDSSS